MAKARKRCGDCGRTFGTSKKLRNHERKEGHERWRWYRPLEGTSPAPAAMTIEESSVSFDQWGEYMVEGGFLMWNGAMYVTGEEAYDT